MVKKDFFLSNCGTICQTFFSSRDLLTLICTNICINICQTFFAFFAFVSSQDLPTPIWTKQSIRAKKDDLLRNCRTQKEHCRKLTIVKVYLIDKHNPMIMKLLNDHVTHRRLTRSRTSRNSYSIFIKEERGRKTIKLKFQIKYSKNEPQNTMN